MSDEKRSTVVVNTVTVKGKDNKREKRYIWELYNSHQNLVAQSWPKVFTSPAAAKNGAYDSFRVMQRWVTKAGLIDSHLTEEQKLAKKLAENQTLHVEGKITNPDEFTQALAGIDTGTPVIVDRKTPNLITRILRGAGKK